MMLLDDAIALIAATVEPLPNQIVAPGEVSGRVAAISLRARLTQPPFDASAMDGYAVRFAEAKTGARLKLGGAVPAGEGDKHILHKGEAIRVFTGSVMPEAADHVVIQEHVQTDGDQIIIEQKQTRPRHIRKAGIDFQQNDILVEPRQKMHELHGSLLAAANIDTIAVTAQPRLALFSCGNELIEPGTIPSRGQIINSNHYALSALAHKWGALPNYHGCAPDNRQQIAETFRKAKQHNDIIVVTGGASVGDHDHVRPAFEIAGGKIIFAGLAIRPGKPTWFGSIDSALVVGLPGNPASAIIAAALLLRPLIMILGGQDLPKTRTAMLGSDLPANGRRETWLRAIVRDGENGENGSKHIAPIDANDSSLLLPFATANALLRRKIDAAPARRGDMVDFIKLW